jgi:hypothetical protein
MVQGQQVPWGVRRTERRNAMPVLIDGHNLIGR